MSSTGLECSTAPRCSPPRHGALAAFVRQLNLAVLMRRSGRNRCIARLKKPRWDQSRSLLHPVRLTVHEDPDPELEVDERPDRVERQDTLAQAVGVKDSPVETPW